MTKKQENQQDKINAWVKFYSDLYQQSPERDYSLQEWHDWYKDNKKAIDDLVAEVDPVATKFVAPESVLLSDKINIPQAPNAVEPRKKKTAFEIAVGESNDEVKKLAAEEARLVKKIGDEYRLTKYEPLFDALQEYESRLQHHIKIRVPLMSEIDEAMEKAKQSVEKVTSLNSAIADIEVKQKDLINIKNHQDVNAANRKEAMKDLKKSLQAEDNSSLANKISVFLANLNNENKLLNASLFTNMNIPSLEKIGFDKLKETAQYLVQEFDAPQPKVKGFMERVQGVFKVNPLSNYEILENARQAQQASINHSSAGLDINLRKINASRIKATNTMESILSSVVRAQTRYAHLLQNHYDEAKSITARASRRFNEMDSNKGQRATAELAEFEMRRTYNMLEAIRIDRGEIIEVAKNSTDYTKTTGILSRLYKIYDHFMTQWTSNEKLKTPVNSSVPSLPKADIQNPEIVSPNVAGLSLQEPSISQIKIPSFEELLQQSNLNSLEQLAPPSSHVASALKVPTPPSSQVEERSADFNKSPLAASTISAPESPPRRPSISASPTSRNISELKKSAVSTESLASSHSVIPVLVKERNIEDAKQHENLAEVISAQSNQRSVPVAPPIASVPPAPPVPVLSSVNLNAEPSIASNSGTPFQLGPREGGFVSVEANSVPDVQTVASVQSFQASEQASAFQKPTKMGALLQDIHNSKELKRVEPQALSTKPKDAMGSLRDALAKRRKVIKEDEKSYSDSESEENDQLNTLKSSALHESGNEKPLKVPVATPSNPKFKAPVRSR